MKFNTHNTLKYKMSLSIFLKNNKKNKILNIMKFTEFI